jgi:hypothetical protein
VSARWRLWFVPLLLLASGCLLTRLYTIRERVCQFDQNFAFDEAAPRLTFREPELFDTDVAWLVGADPTPGDTRGLASYHLVLASRPTPLPISLSYAPEGRRLLLGAIELPAELAGTLTRALVRQFVGSLCGAREDIVRAEVVFDLDELDRALLPDRARLEALLGPAPTGTWRFHLAEDPRRTGTISATFDAQGSLAALRTDWYRYALDADFVARRARLRVRP